FPEVGILLEIGRQFIEGQTGFRFGAAVTGDTISLEHRGDIHGEGVLGARPRNGAKEQDSNTDKEGNASFHEQVVSWQQEKVNGQGPVGLRYITKPTCLAPSKVPVFGDRKS